MEAGFGRAVITPALPVVLAGFGARKQPATEVHDDLEVHALVLRDEGTTVCLLVLDLLLLGPDFAAPVRAAVASSLGIPVGHVLTSCVHTHAGPAASRTMKRAGWPVAPGYLDALVAGCVRAARDAHGALAAARLSYARGPLPSGLGRNRRDLPYHPSHAALEVRSADGGLLGTVGNVGIHPVALGPTCLAVSSDWIGTYRRVLRERTGAPAVLLMGAMGDVDPHGFSHDALTEGGDWDLAERVGTDVAHAVQDLMTRTQLLPDDVTVLPVRTLRPRAGLTLMTLLGNQVGRRLPLELHEWSLGGVRLVSVPGEPFDALGRDVLAARDDRALVAAISPVWHGYLPVPFRKGYEERMSGGRRFVAAVASALTTRP
ncbi:MAG TPA: hypothetical protein VM097_09555 [Mycobacteriales bacterium]|nr:hypothetical protein [Mycobacteriales bacterium]